MDQPQTLPLAQSWRSDQIDVSGLAHGANDGLALNEQGDVVALAVPHAAINEIALISVSDLNITKIVARNKRILLAHPTFGSTGRILLFLATPPSYWGISEIWMLDLLSGAFSSYGRPNYSYIRALLSLDGREIYCFRNIEPPSDPSLLRPEHRTSLIYGIYVINIETKAERRVSQDNFYFINGLFLSMDLKGLFYSASRASTEEGPEIPASPTISYLDITNGQSRKIDALGEVRLKGSESHGRLLLAASLLDQERAEYSVEPRFWDGNILANASVRVSTGEIQDMTCSWDGQSIATLTGNHGLPADRLTLERRGSSVTIALDKIRRSGKTIVVGSESLS